MHRELPMIKSRRRFLLGTGALAASAALPNVLFAHTGGTSRLVVVILRGALDGMAAVPPYGDPDYASLHRELAIAAPGGADGALILDNTFGLHPSLTFLHERYAAGELIVFNAVASPYRETEAMPDGSDAVADWPILNALLNTAAGASWVSVHNGGGVGIGYALHAGQVTVADGTESGGRSVERVLTCDPGIGVLRHVDAGYEPAIEFAEQAGLRAPMRRQPTKPAGGR